ncbi:hypothetical protein BC832DRAFT_596061 [Gaertneriomyces semiglobifer]|nr:hypothetical protein BC832DRAFT_596061 [Gaertneriomyces semiglobifer]
MTSSTYQSAKSDTSALWSEAQTLERTLRSLDAKKRQRKSFSLDDAEERILRTCLLEIYEDLIICDPVSAAAKAVDDKIWNLVFYTRIEELRSLVRRYQTEQGSLLGPAVQELLRHVEQAISFYLTALVILRSTISDDLAEYAVQQYQHVLPPNDSKKASFALLHKFLVSCGDLSRYREIYATEERKQWRIPRWYYQKAIRLNPDVGMPMAQLAIVASQVGNHLEVMYWYCLSLASTTPHQFTKENMSAFYNNRESRLQRQSISDEAMSPLQQMVEHVLSFHRMVFMPSQILPSKVLEMHTAISTLTIKVISTTSQTTSVPDAFKAIFCIMIGTYHHLDNQFSEIDDVALRRSIRIAQVFITATTLELAATLFDLLHEEMTASEIAITSLADVNPIYEFLVPVGVVAVWLEQSMDVFSVWNKYIETFEEGATLQPILMRLARSLCQLANVLTSFADMEGSTEAVPEDADLLGLIPLRPYYAKLSSASLVTILQGRSQSASDQMAVRLSRIAHFTSVLANDPGLPFFVLDETDGSFIVVDDAHRLKGMQRLMKTLATERLRDQVLNLEKQVAKQHELPIVMADTDSWIWQMSKVKTWLMSRNCVIIIPLKVIDDLDRLKKGNEGINARAREAIRYLEQRFHYRSPFLRAQQPSEFLAPEEIPWDRRGYLKNKLYSQSEDSDATIPKHARAILSCALYFQRQIAAPSSPSPANDTKRMNVLESFALITDDVTVRTAAQSVGVTCKGVEEFESALGRTSVEKGRKRRRDARK